MVPDMLQVTPAKLSIEMSYNYAILEIEVIHKLRKLRAVTEP